MNRRALLGMGAAVAAAPKSAAAALLRMGAQIAGGGQGYPSPGPDAYSRGGLDPIYRINRVTGGGGGLMDLIGVAEKATLALHEDRLAAVRAAFERRRYHRQFLYSMSPAAKRAYDRADEQELAAAEGAVYGFIDKLRRAYYPEHYLEKDCGETQVDYTRASNRDARR